MEVSSVIDFFHPLDEAEFLEAMSYANESAWFAFDKPMSLVDSYPFAEPWPSTARSSTPVDQYEDSQTGPVQLMFAPIIETQRNSTHVHPRRSGSTSSVDSSPEAYKARPVPRPISPSATERRRLRTFSSDDESSPTEESSDDGSYMGPVAKSVSNPSRKRARVTSNVCHTSAFRGVSCCGKDRKFQARIRDGSKVHYLGRFDNEFDAAIKYDEAARSHKGDSAMPNFVVMSPEEVQTLRAHYFANDQHIMPEFHHYLFQGTLERLEMKRSRKLAAATAQ